MYRVGDNVLIHVRRVLSWKHTSKCAYLLRTHIHIFWVFSEVVGIATVPVIVI